MYAAKPTQLEYLDMLQERSAEMASLEPHAFQHVFSGNPIEEMLAAQPPAELLAQTTYQDYGVASLFTTDYAAPGFGPRRVRVIGVFSLFFSFHVREF